MDIEGVPLSKELIELMTERGYQAYEFGDNGFVPHEVRDRYEYGNILFLPKKMNLPGECLGSKAFSGFQLSR